MRWLYPGLTRLVLVHWWAELGRSDVAGWRVFTDAVSPQIYSFGAKGVQWLMLAHWWVRPGPEVSASPLVGGAGSWVLW